MTSSRFKRALIVPTYSADNENFIAEGSTAAIDLTEEEGLRAQLRHAGAEPQVGWPQLVVERRRNGWMVFVSGNAGDESGYLQIHDDGRLCLMRERVGIEIIQCPEPGEPGIDLD